MKPFAYYSAKSIEEAAKLLNQSGMDVQPLAGGTDLLVQLRHDLKQVDAVVDIKGIPELNQLTYDTENGLIVDAAGIIGGTAIQERASLGGNLCNAAPSGDAIPAMIVLKAICAIARSNGTRMIPVENICTNPGKTVLQKGDLLVSIHFPPQSSTAGSTYLRFTPRREMDIAIAGAGVWVLLSEDLTTIIDARIALSAVAPTPLLVGEASDILVGNPPDEATITKAAEAAQNAARPISDMRGTTAQRQHLVKVLVKRALQQAIQRATRQIP